jgi:hypothetical protein
MHKNATKCNKTQSKWCINKHGASKIIDRLRRISGALREGEGVALGGAGTWRRSGEQGRGGARGSRDTSACGYAGEKRQSSAGGAIEALGGEEKGRRSGKPGEVAVTQQAGGDSGGGTAS